MTERQWLGCRTTSAVARVGVRVGVEGAGEVVGVWAVAVMCMGWVCVCGVRAQLPAKLPAGMSWWA